MEKLGSSVVAAVVSQKVFEHDVMIQVDACSALLSAPRQFSSGGLSEGALRGGYRMLCDPQHCCNGELVPPQANPRRSAIWGAHKVREVVGTR